MYMTEDAIQSLTASVNIHFAKCNMSQTENNICFLMSFINIHLDMLQT